MFTLCALMLIANAKKIIVKIKLFYENIQINAIFKLLNKKL